MTLKNLFKLFIKTNEFKSSKNLQIVPRKFLGEEEQNDRTFKTAFIEIAHHSEGLKIQK